MSNNPNVNRKRTTRRTVLGTTGSIAAFGLTGIKSVEAQPGSTIGNRYIAKAELELTDLPELSEQGGYPITHWDTPQDHIVHDGTLYLLETVSEAEVKDVHQNQSVVRRGSFRRMGRNNPVFGSRIRAVPTHLGEAMQSSYVLNPNDEYEAPRIVLNPGEDGLRLGGPAVSGTVPVGSEKRFELPADEVEVEVERTTDEKVDQQDVPERLRGLKIERWTETVTIQPELVVRNLGELEVVDATDEVTVSTG